MSINKVKTDIFYVAPNVLRMYRFWLHRVGYIIVDISYHVLQIFGQFCTLKLKLVNFYHSVIGNDVGLNEDVINITDNRNEAFRYWLV